MEELTAKNIKVLAILVFIILCVLSAVILYVPLRWFIALGYLSLTVVELIVLVRAWNKPVWKEPIGFWKAIALLAFLIMLSISVYYVVRAGWIAEDITETLGESQFFLINLLFGVCILFGNPLGISRLMKLKPPGGQSC